MGALCRSAISVVGHVDVVGVSINYGAIRAGDGPGGTDAGICDDGGSTATILQELFVNGPSKTQSTVWNLPGGTDPNSPLPNGYDPTTPHQPNLLLNLCVDDLENDKSVVVRIDVRIVPRGACPSTPGGVGECRQLRQVVGVTKR